ncbi:MAG TPA: SDR family oxidoreductase [Bdellovibrionota bacterium]|nr:SDR family oxidoreductase [Bdellovibrionota bacterium]
MRIDRNSVVIITGASRGIGRAAAIEFAKRGAKVVVASRDEAKMKEVADRVREAGGEPMVVACDVAVEKSCQELAKRTLARFSRIDILINNAGFGYYSPVEDLSTEKLDQIFRTNLYGTIWCTQAVLPQMKKQNRGHIVNVSTIISGRSIPFMSAYCMTKFAMRAFDESLRLEVRSHGIGVSHVCPGLTTTDFQTNAVRVEGSGPPVPNQMGMSPEKVGRAIFRAVERNKREVTLTMNGKIMLTLQRISPRLTDAIIALYMRRKMHGTQAASGTN